MRDKAAPGGVMMSRCCEHRSALGYPTEDQRQGVCGPQGAHTTLRRARGRSLRPPESSPTARPARSQSPCELPSVGAAHPWEARPRQPTVCAPHTPRERGAPGAACCCSACRFPRTRSLAVAQKVHALNEPSKTHRSPPAEAAACESTHLYTCVLRTRTAAPSPVAL